MVRVVQAHERNKGTADQHWNNADVEPSGYERSKFEIVKTDKHVEIHC